jgi:YD repeat-containing protein
MANYCSETTRSSKHGVLFALSAAFITFAAGLPSSAVNLQLGVNPPNASDDSTPSINLTWDALSDGVYLVQSKTNLENAVWKTEEPVRSSIGPIKWMAPEALERSKFYRLVLPQPDIFGVEPSVISTQGGTIYLLGQQLSTNGMLRIGSLVLPPNVLNPGSTYSFTLPPMAEGTYDVEWLDGGQVVAARYKMFSVTAESTPVGEVRARLLEPPAEPPASPSRRSYTGGKYGLEMDGKMCSTAAGDGFALWPHMHQLGRNSEGQLWGKDSKQTVTENAVGQMRESTKHPAKLEVPNLKMFSGELQVEATDMVIPGRGLDFAWVRTYRSRTGTNTAMGNGWDFSYNLFIQKLGGDILVHNGTGRDDRFFAQTNGTYSAPEFFCEGSFSKNVFILSFPDTGKWVFNPLDSSAQAGKISQIVDRNGNSMSFWYDGTGKLTTIVDDLGRTNSLGYDTNGFIQTLTDFSGREVNFNHHGSSTSSNQRGQLLSVTSPPVIGTPNGNDFPDGKTTTYTYSANFTDEALNNNLLSITDGLQQTWLQVVYNTNADPASLDYDAVDHMERGPYPIKLRRISQAPTPSNNFAVVKCIVNDGVGNVSECFFDAKNRCVRQLDYTGRANPDLPTTETQNRPTGKLRSDDPDFYETLFTWNVDSLCTRITYPNGNAITCTYESDFDKNAVPRKKGDLRVLRELACCGGADMDGDGVNDLTERAWHFSYDPRFGSPGICSGKKLYVGNLPFSATDASRGKGSPSGTSDGSTSQWPLLANESLSYEWSLPSRPSGSHSGLNRMIMENHAPESFLAEEYSREMKLTSGQPTIIDNKRGLFVSSVIDPLGNSASASYDNQGNMVHSESRGRKSGAIIACDFNYKANGKLTAVTNAPDGNGVRRIDLLNYYDSGPQAGYLADWTVDTAGPVVTITRFEYDQRGNVTRCVDPRTNDWLFTYNSLDQIVQSQTPTNVTSRCTTDYFYDACNNHVQTRIEVRDENDNKVLEYSSFKHPDLLNRCVRIEQQRDATNFVACEFQYDANDNLVLYRSPEAVNGNDTNNVVRHEYDERNLAFRSVCAPGTGLGATNEWSYTLNGNVRRVKCELYVENFTYDGFSRCVGITNGMGNAEICAYDANDNLVYRRCDGELLDQPGSAQNRRLSEMRCTYDGFNRCVRTSLAHFDPVTQQPTGDGSSVSTCVYAPNSQVMSVTDDNGHQTLYAYDTLGRLSSVTDAKHNVVIYAHDTCGNLLNETSVEHSDLGGADQVFSMTYLYDNLGRCTNATDNVGNTDQYAYDSRNNVVRYVDHNYNVSRCDYDGLNRRTLAVADLDGDGLVDLRKDAGSLCMWDDNSRLMAYTDANTNTTHYVYDSVDRLITTTNPDQTTESLIWSPRSNLASRTDGNGTVTTNIYDLLDRCVQSNITPGSGVAATTTFEMFQYDGLSRCVMASNDVSRLYFAFDSLGNCMRSSQDGLTNSSTFDGVGNRLSMSYPGGRGVQFMYDELDRVSSVMTTRCEGCGNPWLGILGYAYDGPSHVSAIFRTNGVNTRIRYNGIQGQPNPPGDLGWQQVASINHAFGGQVIDRRIFAYDGNQNKTLRAQTAPFAPNQPTTTNIWSYTPLNQLSKAINTKGTGATLRSYHLDAKGNRIAVTNDATVDLYSRDATLPEPADFQMDQYTLTPFGIEQHDHNGNLIQLSSAAGPTAYHYDYADRLVEVDGLDNNGILGPLVSYSYDALGRCISKTTYPAAPSAPLTTQYVHGGETDKDCNGGPIEERVNGVVSRAYVSGLAIGDLDRDGWPDRVAFTGGGEPIYYHTDELGNVLALTDANGAVLERYDYDDYGMPTFLTSDGSPMVGSDGLPVMESPLGNPYLFHGMCWDAQTALYEESGSKGENPLFEGAASGRYLSPAHCSDGSCVVEQNQFSFAGNNPWTAGMIRSRNKHQGDYLPAHNFKIEIDGCMMHLHKEGVIHRDLSARNILLSTDTDSAASADAEGIFYGKEGSRVIRGHFESGDKPTQSQRMAINTKGAGTNGRGINGCFHAINTKGAGTNGRVIKGCWIGLDRSGVSNVLKTKHDTAKNAIGNIR